MKVLISHSIPFALAHGGTQTVIEALLKYLPDHGVDVEPERWWDEEQTADMVHYFGRPDDLVARLALSKGRSMVITEFMDHTARRSRSALTAQALLIRAVRSTLRGMTGRMGWQALRQADALVVAVKREAEIACQLFGVDFARCHVVPHGLTPEAIAAIQQPDQTGSHLISVATIHPRKNSLLLARAAKEARVPVVFLGKPYAEDEYTRAFMAEVDDEYVNYPGFVSEEEKAAYIRTARGFVLLSEYESGCIAVYEAAAARLPQLLPRRNWALDTYAALPGISTCPVNAVSLPQDLKAFYEQAASLSEPSFEVPTWSQVAQSYTEIYKQILA